MAPSKLKRAIGAVKDQTSISLAKVGSSNSLSDLEVAILKATSHEEHPAEEKYIREVLVLTSYSNAYVRACVNIISRRLNKTKNWTVALKTLMLVQRLLSEGDPAYEQEIFFSTRRGTRLLNMSDFREKSSSNNSWDYSAFVRTYALYLDERLEFRMHCRRGNRSMFGIDEDKEAGCQDCARATPFPGMKTEHLFSRMQHLQQLIERFLACRPTGAAKSNRVVIVALYAIVKDSFQIYCEVIEILSILIDRFVELEITDSTKVYEIFCRVSKQFDELDMFYCWCKTVGIGRSSEYPEVEKITSKKLELMDEFIRDKAALPQGNNAMNPNLIKNEAEEDQEEEEEEEETKEDMNEIKALEAPKDVSEEPPAAEELAKEEIIVRGDDNHEAKEQQQEADLLNLGEDAVTSEEHADKLALALFDIGAADPANAPTWEAFKDETADWETALVQSASGLPHQKATMGGGFDMLLLDGMYQQGAAMVAVGNGASGSASSVALESAGRAGALALPAPPTMQDGGSTATTNVDPFAASSALATPPFVQMSDMKIKQKLLVEEQLMWQQYARDGMQGQLGMAKGQPNPHNMGGYTPGY